MFSILVVTLVGMDISSFVASSLLFSVSFIASVSFVLLSLSFSSCILAWFSVVLVVFLELLQAVKPSDKIKVNINNFFSFFPPIFYYNIILPQKNTYKVYNISKSIV